MNIIELTKQIITDCPLISQFTNNVHVDFTESTPTNFGLSSTGDRLVKEDILGNQLRQHNFVLYAVNQSFSDYDRLVNSTFLLDLAYWLEKFESDVELEVVIDGKTYTGKFKSLSSANGMLYQVINGDMNQGVMYQIQIYAQYTIESEVM